MVNPRVWSKLRLASTPLSFRSKLALVIWDDISGTMTTKLPMFNKRSTSGPLESAAWASLLAHPPSVSSWPSKKPTSRSGNISSELSIIYPNSLPLSRMPYSIVSSPHSLVNPPPPLSPQSFALSSLYPSNLLVLVSPSQPHPQTTDTRHPPSAPPSSSTASSPRRLNPPLHGGPSHSDEGGTS